MDRLSSTIRRRSASGKSLSVSSGTAKALTLGVTSDKAEEIADHLYAVAFAAATRQKNWYLTRAELLRVIHDRTQLSLPAAT